MASINELKGLASRKGGFAQSSQYLVKLPSLGFFDSRELNLLCKMTAIPGRQILTSDRKIGIKKIFRGNKKLIFYHQKLLLDYF